MTDIFPINKNNFKESLRYYQTYLGLKMYTIFLLVALAGLLEGLGLTLIVPFLERILGESITNSGGYWEGILTVIDTTISFCVSIFSISEQLAISIILLSVFALKSVFVFFALSFSAYLRSNLGKVLRVDLIEKISRAKIEVSEFHEKSLYGNLVTEQTNRIVQAFYFITQLFYNISTIIIYVIIILLMSVKFFLFLLAGGIIFIIFFRSLNKFVGNLSIQKVRYISKLNNLTVEFISHIKYAKSTANEDLYTPPLASIIRAIRQNDFRNGIASSLTISTREIIALSFVICLVATKDFFFSGYTSHLLAAALIIYRTTSAIMNAQKLWQSTLEYIGSIHHYQKYFNELELGAEQNGTKKITKFKKINFINASYRYVDSDDFVISEFSWELIAGLSYGITGPSGIGKSTIIDMITLNRQPNSGKITIDSIDAIDIDKVSWREQIGFVSQYPSIRNCSVVDFICEKQRGEKNYDAIRAALDSVGLLDFFDSKDRGLDYELGEGGSNLSGGQRQRLALAREIFRMPQILILDEVSSGLDAASEAEIKEALIQIKNNITLVVISHRDELLSVADEIIDLAIDR